jgi:hypothetical protein
MFSTTCVDEEGMVDRRVEARMLCADLVDVRWKDAETGRSHRMVANLEDISLSGACIQTDRPVPLKTSVRIYYPGGALTGVVRYCVYREIGYFMGIEFGNGCRWSKEQFRPQHMLDPRRLIPRSRRQPVAVNG